MVCKNIFSRASPTLCPVGSTIIFFLVVFFLSTLPLYNIWRCNLQLLFLRCTLNAAVSLFLAKHKFLLQILRWLFIGFCFFCLLFFSGATELRSDRYLKKVIEYILLKWFSEKKYYQPNNAYRSLAHLCCQCP